MALEDEVQPMITTVSERMEFLRQNSYPAPMPESLPLHNPALPVVCFDFDGVLAANTWPSPKIGKPDEDALDAIWHYHDLGCEVIILTARPDSHFRRIWKWLEEQGVSDAIYEVTGRKCQASLYFDDRGVRWPL